ncbi:mycothiol transferase [Anatilimnocola floriformis]|uniref:mycothiol transferase n=1 Tax=Anatilimnocola floriformis TaxID=2948575 RepID=UPI0020C2A7C6|nr:DUF664 domain-containing protein [Anatilimnocola floriformis]
MPDQTLLAALAEIRGSFLRSLSGVDEEQARWRVAGLANNILWHAGHAYVVVEWLTMGPLGLDPVAPAGWFELFSWESRPAEIPLERFPTLAEIVKQLEAQQQRLQTLFASLGELDLKNAAVDQPDQSVRAVILHGLQDEACHRGEVRLLRKLYALRSPHQ